MVLFAFGRALRRRRVAFSVLELFPAGADHDAAAPGAGQGSGGVGVEIDCVLGGGDCVGANHAAQLAFGDLADEGVVEDELGAERGVGAETGERLVKVPWPGLVYLASMWFWQCWSQFRMPSTAWEGPTRPMGI
ncbi:hypothetical protein [Streptomyces sp. NPDC004296]|uniref:hypothetical protein n=1 Tax=Streptomyces sp. NPDC004296 TaxID=3364697 RepID=UPI00368215B2